MKVQRLNEEMFAPMEQNEMMLILGGGKTKYSKVIITSKDGQTTIETIKWKEKDG